MCQLCPGYAHLFGPTVFMCCCEGIVLNVIAVYITRLSILWEPHQSFETWRKR